MRCDIWSGGGPVAGIPILVIQQTMLLLAVLAMRAILPHFTRWRHIMLLWYVVLIRLAIPFPLPDPFSLLKHPSAPASYVPQATPTSDFAQAGSDWLETDAGRVSLCVWTAIAVALLACQAASLLRWKRSHTQLSPVDDPDILAFADSYWRNPKHSLATRSRLFLDRLFGAANAHALSMGATCKSSNAETRPAQGVQLMWSSDVATPVVFGCTQPVVLIPPKVAYGHQAKRHAIEHELSHIRRQDPLFKLIFSCVCCLFWFNPLVWVARRLSFRDIELACDEEVTRFGTRGEKRAYAELLLEFAQPTQRGVCRTWVSHFSSGHAAVLAMRIKALKSTITESGVSSLAVCAMAACLALTVSTTGPASGNNPWVVKTELGSIAIPQAWWGKVQVSILRTTGGTEVAFVCPLGEPTRPILGFGSLDEHPCDDPGSATSLVAVTSHNGYSCALWGFDYGSSGETESGSNQLDCTQKAVVTGDSDMDSLGFLKRAVAPTFCVE